MHKTTAIALVLALVPSLAFGQGAIRQSGPSTQFDPLGFIQDHQAEAASKIFTDNGRGFNPIHTYDAGGLGPCTENALTTGAYTQLCLGHDSSGNGVISLNSFGGAGAKVLNFDVSGVTYQFPGNFVSLRSANPGNFYLSTTGNDSNSCTTLATPCLTFQGVVNKALRSYDAAAGHLTINAAAGTYSAGFVCSGPISGGGSGNVSFDGSMLNIVGAGSGLTAIADTTSGQNGAIIVSAGCTVQLSHLTITTNQTGAADLFIQNHGIVENGVDVVYGGAQSSNIHVEWGGIWETFTNFTLAGGALSAFAVSNGGMVEIDPSGLTATISGNPTYSVGFANVVDRGIFYTGNVTFSGTAVGPRAKITSGGLIETLNATETYLPGNSAVINQGGIYSPEPIATVLPGATGLGTVSGFHGTVTMGAGSNSSDGFILLNAGTAATAGNGQAFIHLPITIQGSGGALAPVTCTPNGSSSAWNAPIIQCNQDFGTPNQLDVTWLNTTPGSATNTVLTPNNQYAINYTVRGRN